MKKLIVLLAILLLLLLFGCNSPDNRIDDSKFYKLTPIPSECNEYRGDECDVFSCMVPNCWCESGPDRILKQGGLMLIDEDRAESEVRTYLSEQEITDYTITNSVELNDVFFNIFIEIDGDEEVFTVASNGTILKTQCGV